MSDNFSGRHVEMGHRIQALEYRVAEIERSMRRPARLTMQLVRFSDNDKGGVPMADPKTMKRTDKALDTLKAVDAFGDDAPLAAPPQWETASEDGGALDVVPTADGMSAVLIGKRPGHVTVTATADPGDGQPKLSESVVIAITTVASKLVMTVADPTPQDATPPSA